MIEARELRFRYPGSASDALAGLSFDVAPGEVLGLLGPTGAGKSTTVALLTGALAGWTGALRVLNGEGPPDASRRERIGVGFEHPALYARLTARENLELFAAMYSGPTAPPDELLAELGLEGMGDQLVERLSKGMRTRLDLCRALLPRPALLFLDEPTSAQDPANGRRVRELIRRRADAGAAVLLTTHDMHVAGEVCDRVALLVGGRIAALDTPRALQLREASPEVRLEVRDEAGDLSVRRCPLPRLADDAELRALLRSGRVETLHTCEPSLEEVFLRVTGRPLA